MRLRDLLGSANTMSSPVVRLARGVSHACAISAPGRPLALSEDIERPGDRELTSKLSIISSLTC